MRLRGMESSSARSIRGGVHVSKARARAMRFSPTELADAYIVELERH